MFRLKPFSFRSILALRSSAVGLGLWALSFGLLAYAEAGAEVCSPEPANDLLNLVGATAPDSRPLRMETQLTGAKFSQRPSSADNVSFIDTEFNNQDSHGSLVRSAFAHSFGGAGGLEGSGSTQSWSEFLKTPDQLGDSPIVNISLHLGGSDAFAEAIERMRKGRTLVISSGNHGDQPMDRNNRLGDIVVGSVDPRTGFVDAYSQGGPEVTILAPVGREFEVNGGLKYGTSYAAPQVSAALESARQRLEAVGIEWTPELAKALLQNTALRLVGSDSGLHGAGMLNRVKLDAVVDRLLTGSYSTADIENPEHELYDFSGRAADLSARADGLSAKFDQARDAYYQALLLDQSPERAKAFLRTVDRQDPHRHFYESLQFVDPIVDPKNPNRFKDQQRIFAEALANDPQLSQHSRESAERMQRILSGEAAQDLSALLAEQSSSAGLVSILRQAPRLNKRVLAQIEKRLQDPNLSSNFVGGELRLYSDHLPPVDSWRNASEGERALNPEQRVSRWMQAFRSSQALRFQDRSLDATERTRRNSERTRRNSEWMRDLYENLKDGSSRDRNETPETDDSSALARSLREIPGLSHPEDSLAKARREVLREALNQYRMGYFESEVLQGMLTPSHSEDWAPLFADPLVRPSLVEILLETEIRARPSQEPEAREGEIRDLSLDPRFVRKADEEDSELMDALKEIEKRLREFFLESPTGDASLTPIED